MHSDPRTETKGGTPGYPKAYWVGGSALVVVGVIVLGGFWLKGTQHPEAMGSGDSENRPPIQTQSARPPGSRAMPEREPIGGIFLDPAKTLLNPLRSRLEAGLAGIHAESDPTRSNELMEALVRGIRDEELPIALAALTHPDCSETGKVVFDLLLNRWTEADPASASEWVVLMPEGQARTDAVGLVGRVWSTRDMEEALDWVRGLGSDGDRRGALMQIAYELVGTDPLAALGLGNEFMGAPGGEDAVGHLASQWASASPEEAAKWAVKIDRQEFRERVLAGVLTVWGDQDPEAAAAAALRTMDPGKSQSDAVVGIVQRWAQQTPASAGDWVRSFPEGSLKTSVSEELVRAWADQDAAGTERWLKEAPAGESRDAAYAAYAGKLLLTNPRSAAVWVNEVGDAERRKVELDRVLEVWSQADPAGAAAWVSGQKAAAKAAAVGAENRK